MLTPTDKIENFTIFPAIVKLRFTAFQLWLDWDQGELCEMNTPVGESFKKTVYWNRISLLLTRLEFLTCWKQRGLATWFGQPLFKSLSFRWISFCFSLSCFFLTWQIKGNRLVDEWWLEYFQQDRNRLSKNQENTISPQDNYLTSFTMLAGEIRRTGALIAVANGNTCTFLLTGRVVTRQLRCWHCKKKKKKKKKIERGKRGQGSETLQSMHWIKDRCLQDIHLRRLTF